MISSKQSRGRINTYSAQNKDISSGSKRVHFFKKSSLKLNHGE